MSGIDRELVEIAARGEHGQLSDDEQHASTRCIYCGNMHLGKFTEDPPDGFCVRYYCPIDNKMHQGSYP